MTDVLIRDVPEDVLAAIDNRARRLGLSRTDYLRRALAREASVVAAAVTTDHLRQLAERFTDLSDRDLMRRAWE